MPKSLGNHAIVLGAGMAGLATAQVLSSHFSKVTVLERDLLPGESAQWTVRPRSVSSALGA